MEDECFSDVFSSESGSDEEFYGFENEEESDEYTSEHDDDPNDVSCDVDIAVSTNFFQGIEVYGPRKQ